MWRRILNWLNLNKPTAHQTERLDEATRGLIAAQAGANAEAKAVANTAASARFRAVTQRAQLQRHAEEVRAQSLHTGDMLRNVEEMLADMQARAAKHPNRH